MITLLLSILDMFEYIYVVYLCTHPEKARAAFEGYTFNRKDEEVSQESVAPAFDPDSFFNNPEEDE